LERIEHDRLNQILKQGENSAVEFMKGDVRPESLAKEIVSFANSYGGVILSVLQMMAAYAALILIDHSTNG